MAFSTQYCLTATVGSAGTKVDVSLLECDRTWHIGAQKFHPDKFGNIRPNGKLDHCLAVDGNASRNGSKVQVQHCVSNDGSIGKASAFLLSTYTGRIQVDFGSLDHVMCLAIEGDHAFNGAKVVAAPCHDVRGDESSGPQDWLQLANVPGSQVAYASPNKDKSCVWPFRPVLTEAACVTAANVLSPMGGCMFGDTLKRWAAVIERLHERSWPAGCHFYGACQGGCSLGFNPDGVGASCPTQGDCMSIDVICELDFRSSRIEKQEHNTYV